MDTIRDAFLTFVKTQWIEFALLAIVIIWLLIFLARNRKKIEDQPLIRIGGFNILSISLARTSWGLALMNTWAKKYREWIKLFGYIAIGIGFIGLALNLVSLIAIIKNIIQTPSTAQVSLVLPFTNVPGLGYLAFSHWIIAIIILMCVHEFSHGVVGRASNITIKTSGMAVLRFLYIPVIPGAFVEQDEKEFETHSDVEKYAMLSAGPVSNILLSIIFLLISLFIFAPLTTHMTEPVGFSFTAIIADKPAALQNVTTDMLFNSVNGKLTNDSSQLFTQLLYNTKPGDQMTLGYFNYTTGLANDSLTKIITTQASPTDASTAFLGISGINNVRDFKPQYKPYEKAFNWFADLVHICFIFNLLIGLINLMPLFITDGGQIVRVFTKQLYAKDKEKAKRAYTIVNLICVSILAAAFIIPLVVQSLR